MYVFLALAIEKVEGCDRVAMHVCVNFATTRFINSLTLLATIANLVYLLSYSKAFKRILIEKELEKISERCRWLSQQSFVGDEMDRDLVLSPHPVVMEIFPHRSLLPNEIIPKL